MWIQNFMVNYSIWITDEGFVYYVFKVRLGMDDRYIIC